MGDESLKKNVLTFLSDDVRELLQAHDFAGTGTNWKKAERDEREWSERLESLIQRLQDAGWGDDDHPTHNKPS